MAAPPASVPSSFSVPLGMVELGTAIGTFGFGIVTCQAYTYYDRFPEDMHSLKLLVATVWLLELGITIAANNALYMSTVAGFGDPLGLLVVDKAQLAVVVMLGILVAAVVQAMFTYRIYKLSGKLLLPITCWTLSFVRPCFGIACGVLAIRSSSALAFVNEFEWLLIVMLGVAAFSDIVVAASLTYYFIHHRADAFTVRNARVLDRLIETTIENGVMTSLSAILAIALYVAYPLKLAGYMPYSLLSRLYSNSLLASLNRRGRLDTNGTQIELSASGGSSGARRPFPLSTRSPQARSSDLIMNIAVERSVQSKVDAFPSEDSKLVSREVGW